MKVYKDFYYREFDDRTNELEDIWESKLFEYSFKQFPYIFYLLLTIFVNILFLTGIVLLAVLVDRQLWACLLTFFFTVPITIVCCSNICEERCFKDKKGEVETWETYYKKLTTQADEQAENWRKEHPLEESVRLILKKKDSVEVTKGIRQLIENLEIGSNPTLQKLYSKLEDKKI